MRQEARSGLYLIGLSLTLEYDDRLDYRYRTGWKTGAEFSLLEMINARIGYYHFTLNPHYETSCGELTDFTYGLGFRLPLDLLLKHKIPLTIQVNIAHMLQPTYTTAIYDWDSFTALTLSMNWRL